MNSQKETGTKDRNTTPKWTKQDYINLTLAMLIKFGDAVEIYLPGVITQKVSCELGLSFWEEGILAVILYATESLSVLAAVPLANKIGERTTLLLSLYCSILFTVFCSIVPNFYTLLLSRALIGLGCGFNVSTIGVYCAKQISSKEILPTFSFLHGCIAFPLGGAWASVLGWLLLDNLGWRIFVLLTSIPLFIPPIIILHCFIKEENMENMANTANKEGMHKTTDPELSSLLQIENDNATFPT